MYSTTIEIDCTRLDIDYEYTPEEKSSADSPGRGAEVEILDITIDGVSVHNLLRNVASDAFWQRIHDAAFDHYAEDSEIEFADKEFMRIRFADYE